MLTHAVTLLLRRSTKHQRPESHDDEMGQLGDDYAYDLPQDGDNSDDEGGRNRREGSDDDEGVDDRRRKPQKSILPAGRLSAGPSKEATPRDGKGGKAGPIVDIAALFRSLDRPLHVRTLLR